MSIFDTWGGDAYGSTEYEAHRLCESCGRRVTRASENRCDGCIYGFSESDPEHASSEKKNGPPR